MAESARGGGVVLPPCIRDGGAYPWSIAPAGTGPAVWVLVGHWRCHAYSAARPAGAWSDQRPRATVAEVRVQRVPRDETDGGQESVGRARLPAR